MQNKVELLTSVKNPRIYAYTEPQYKNTEWVGKRTGKGLLKIGYTERSVIERINEQFPTKKPTDTPYSVLFEDSAIRNDGTFRQKMPAEHGDPVLPDCGTSGI